MRSHKSLVAWQRARAVVDGVMAFALRHWSPPAAVPIRQAQAAALAAQLNIAEGYARGSRKTFRYHLSVAYGSAVETAEILELLADHQMVPAELVANTLALNRELQALLLGLIRRYS